MKISTRIVERPLRVWEFAGYQVESSHLWEAIDAIWQDRQHHMDENGNSYGVEVDFEVGAALLAAGVVKKGHLSGCVRAKLPEFDDFYRQMAAINKELPADHEPPYVWKNDSFPSTQRISQLKQLAAAIVAGKVFTSRHLRDPRDLALVFPALTDLSVEELDQLLKSTGLIYQYVSQASGSSINGMPLFNSFLTLTHQEYHAVDQFANALVNPRRNVKSAFCPDDNSPDSSHHP